jgi:hypothetical protein
MASNYKEFIKYISILSIIIFIILYYFLSKGKIDLKKCLKAIGYTSAIMVVLSFIFNQWLWKKISLIQKYYYTPNISGIWEGKGNSSFNNTEFDVKLSITQTFLETHIHGVFEKSQSDSFCSEFTYDSTHDRTYLIYSYKNEPKLEYRNKAEENEEGGLNIHYGTTKLEIDFNDLTHLNGTYWNDRKCIGTFELTKRK